MRHKRAAGARRRLTPAYDRSTDDPADWRGSAAFYAAIGSPSLDLVLDVSGYFK